MLGILGQRSRGNSAPLPGVGSRLISGHPLAAGLVALYPLNEGAGRVTADLVAGRNGVLNGDGNWGPKGLTFASRVSQIPHEVCDNMSLRDQFTITFWFQGTAAQSVCRLQNNNANYIVVAYGATPMGIMSTDGGAATGVSLAGLNDGNLHFAAVTWRSNTTNGFKSYLDGTVKAQRTSANVLTPNFVTHTMLPNLGGFNASSEYTTGTARMIRIYNRELAQSQIQELMMRPTADLWVPSTTFYSFPSGGSPPASVIFRNRTGSRVRRQ